MPTDLPLLLVADDEAGILRLVAEVGRRAGFTVVEACDGHGALDALSRMSVDVAFIDVRMPDMTGIEVLGALREKHSLCQVVMMTGHGTIDGAIEAMKLGARDYLTKPFAMHRLGETLEAAHAQVMARRGGTDHEAPEQDEVFGISSRSPVMKALLRQMRRLAPYARTVLITGETGTGKEVIAHALHELGPRRAHKFLAMNCSAVVESLFESELFGHMRGSYTGAVESKAGLFEAAGGGTLFLDEIGELPLAMQAKLLRVLDTGEVLRVGATEPKHIDVVMLAATNADLRDKVARGQFREDLYYRLDVASIHVPSLRDRREDIPHLAALFLKDASARMRLPLNRLSADAERRLLAESWHGNVRELRNVVERACLMSEEPIVGVEVIDQCLSETIHGAPPVPPAAATGTADAPLSTVEREHIARVMKEAEGNQTQAAVRLGMSRRALYRKLKKLALR